MILFSNMIFAFLDITALIIFIKVFLLPMTKNGILKKMFLCLCMTAFLFSWHEMFFEWGYALDSAAGSYILQSLSQLGRLGTLLLLVLLDRSSCLPQYGDQAVGKAVTAILCVFPMLEIVWIIRYNFYISCYMSGTQIDRLVSNIGILTWIIFILLDILFFILYYMIQKAQYSRTQAEFLSREFEAKKKHYSDIEQMQLQVRALRHDIKNLLCDAGALIDTGDIVGARSLLMSVDSRISASEQIIVTGNPSLDCILNMKKTIADKAGFQLQTDIDIPSGLSLDYAAMAVILGNLLDNAIEAVEKLPENTRLIMISIKYSDHMLLIQISNRYSGENAHSVYYPTTKECPQDHGFGISNVTHCIENLGGTIQINSDSDWFHAKIVLYDVKPVLND